MKLHFFFIIILAQSKIFNSFITIRFLKTSSFFPTISSRFKNYLLQKCKKTSSNLLNSPPFPEMKLCGNPVQSISSLRKINLLIVIFIIESNNLSIFEMFFTIYLPKSPYGSHMVYSYRKLALQLWSFMLACVITSLCPRPLSHGTEFSNFFPCDALSFLNDEESGTGYLLLCQKTS